MYSLDALERDEAEYTANLRAQVLPVAPEPIGLATEDSKRPSSSILLNQQQQPEVDLRALSNHRPLLFWNQHRLEVEKRRLMRERRRQQQQQRSVVDRSEPVGRPSVGHMNAARTSISTSFSLSSPTGRTG
jgi:hypothetical protein